MDEKKVYYKPLTGWGRNFTGKMSRLYYCADHLLNIESQGIDEDYKRFYFNNIRAIVTRETSQARILNIFLITLITISVIFALSLGDKIFFPIIAGIFTVALVINLAKGTTCVCHLYTAVQRQKLDSLNRIKKAERVIGFIRYHIEQEQGHLTPDEMKEKIPTASISMPMPKSANIASTQPLTVKRTTQEKKPYHGNIHLILFVLLLFYGLSIISSFLYQSIVIAFFQIGFFAGISVLVVVILVIQSKREVISDLKTIVYTIMAYIIISYVFYNGAIMVIIFKNPGIQQPAALKMLIESLSKVDTSFNRGFAIFSLVVSIFTGIMGLLILLGNRQQIPVTPPTLPPDTRES
ncbi:MAG: hypothetical protein A2161_19740 [Candidatus Schekmanbacteria bacterium RBG_13_48_7]|uniref:Uncharacterized protein n=1 Tax=Candidatus Schekmanbacteria bacterium RBG_13_48_7 TaxID=1817878 RepID=A0A1F7S1I8_9BACT|nr:MAG: hypothetical protein A2161_19740 [Candidatus Schekmanbacteria bacterium RBG_13_48_7]